MKSCAILAIHSVVASIPLSEYVSGKYYFVDFFAQKRESVTDAFCNRPN